MLTIVCLLTISFQFCTAQEITPHNDLSLQQGRFYAYWGWNRGWFTKSDISFKGKTYDFVLSEVVATDRQSKFTIEKYFSPTHLTIPQYNFRFDEHTDGLNFLSLEIRSNDNLFNIDKFTFSVFQGLALSAITPRSDISLLNFENQDEFHLSGYGIALSLGAKLQFGRGIFIQTEWKGGHVNMLNVRTTPSKSDSARQHFLFSQWNVVFGSSFTFGK